MKKLLVIYSFIVPLPIVCGRSFWRLPISIGFSQICSQRRAAPIPKKKRWLWNVRIHAIASSIWVERNNRILKTPYPSTSLNEIPLSILWSSGLDVLGLPPFYFSYDFCNLSESSCLPKIDSDSLFWLVELLLSIKKQKKWWMINRILPQLNWWGTSSKDSLNIKIILPNNAFGTFSLVFFLFSKKIKEEDI